MTPLVVEATYEDGVLKPARPLPLKDHAKVEIVIRASKQGECEPTMAVLTERQQSLKRLLSLRLPVADWDQMEEEIIRGAVQ